MEAVRGLRSDPSLKQKRDCRQIGGADRLGLGRLVCGARQMSGWGRAVGLGAGGALFVVMASAMLLRHGLGRRLVSSAGAVVTVVVERNRQRLYDVFGLVRV